MVPPSHSDTPETDLDARHRLIRAGLEVFGHYSFDGATTRMLASEAGVNLAGIPYYFGSKEALYHAVLQYIVDQIRLRAGKDMSEVRAQLDGGAVDPAQALQLLHRLFGAVARTMLGTAEAKHWGRLMMREQMEPSAGYELLYEQLLQPMQEMAGRLVAIVIDRDPRDSEVILRTHALVGQILAFRAARETICRRLRVKDLSADHVDQIQAIIEEHVELILLALRLRADGSRKGRTDR
jgi:AcrR family transcriptional regulator